ncbi:FecR family protein [Chitinophaga eiseniae]|uniref:DUF4974 domain-containing protein n=1 Tax=Chitinophaga eiseniae TaxID=634771 RepID=A0A847SH15_9BACT|nr:FecR family protein [Chitinophaga eiseniae]NLR78325.1 DUF4974 domain-containing protein [Chitinophaga eiseniae]
MTFEALFQKYMSGTLNAEELRQFRTMARQPENKALLDQLLQQAFTDPAYIENADYNAEEMAAEIMMQTRMQDAAMNVVHKVQIPLISRSWFKYAAAAAIFLLLLGISWKWHTHRYRANKMMARLELPTRKATHPILILGDGSRISLDSAGNGTIAQQGAAQVVKLANGELAYHPSGAKAGALIFNTMQTPNGSQYQLTLPDGSRVWLNAASSIRYPATFADSSRRVEVTGEAYFDIAADAGKPFIVAAKGMDIRVLGTAFNVKAYTEEEAIKTTLVQGAVKVNDQVVLHPGEQAVLHHSTGQLLVNKPNMEETLGWKNGEFYFRETNIRSIMQEVARWYDVEVKYEGDLTNVTLSGIVARTAGITQLLKALELTKIVHFKIQGRTITVMPYQAAN